MPIFISRVNSPPYNSRYGCGGRKMLAIRNALVFGTWRLFTDHGRYVYCKLTYGEEGLPLQTVTMLTTSATIVKMKLFFKLACYIIDIHSQSTFRTTGFKPGMLRAINLETITVSAISRLISTLKTL